MSELTTVARPYAKAAFDFAVEQKALDKWTEMLGFAAKIVADEQIQSMLSSQLSAEKMAELFIAVCDAQLDEHGQNLIRVMAENERLKALPDVADLYEVLVAEHKAVAEVEVRSATALSTEQESKITAMMEKRLDRKVKLNCNVDASLVAGVLIQCGDLVIDGSVRGKLDRLSDALHS